MEKIYKIPICRLFNDVLEVKAESLDDAVVIAKRAISAANENMWIDSGDLCDESPSYIATYIQAKYPELNKEDIQKELQDD